MSELKPCPFCGKTPYTLTGKGWARIMCDCIGQSETVECSAENWNKRKIEDALNARIAELEAANAWHPESTVPSDYRDVEIEEISGKNLPVGYYDHNSRKWFSKLFVPTKVTLVSVKRWRELPEPPESED